MAGTAQIIQDKTGVLTGELTAVHSFCQLANHWNHRMVWDGRDIQDELRGTRGSFPKVLVQLQESLAPCCGRCDSCPGFLAQFLLLPPGRQSRAGSEPCRALQRCEFRCCARGRKTPNKLLRAAQTSCEASPQIAFHARAGWKRFSLINGSQTFRKGFSPA